MSRVQGLEERWIALPAARAGEFITPPEALHALVDRHTGNGRIINERSNGHLSGCVVWNTKEDTAKGYRPRYSLLSLDSAYWQFQEIFDSAMDEATYVAGPIVDSAVARPGEVQRLRENSRLLSEWRALTGDQKLDIGLFYGSMAAIRRRARNRHNVSIAERTESMRTLKDSLGRDNPGAIRAKSLVVEQEATDRALFIIRKVIAANNNRYVNVLNWLIEEDKYTDQADRALDKLAEDPDDKDRLGDVYSAAHPVRFRVQAFNHLAHARKQNGGHLAEEDIRISQRGLRFDRGRWSLMKSFRQLGALSIRALDGNYSELAEKHSPAIADVITQLGEISIGGAYDLVVQDLINIAETTEAFLQQGDHASKILKLAKAFNLRMTHYAFEGEPHYDNFYRDQLYTQKRH